MFCTSFYFYLYGCSANLCVYTFKNMCVSCDPHEISVYTRIYVYADLLSHATHMYTKFVRASLKFASIIN